jgi:hypothetical protein
VRRDQWAIDGDATLGTTASSRHFFQSRELDADTVGVADLNVRLMYFRSSQELEQETPS